mmetsp:Transcript_19202/g.27831  ORF Transcript_19202/g.27831 Transcript_19202/m.27831 type:complete len:201 (+) Transcript_19202:487-1089(+)
MNIYSKLIQLVYGILLSCSETFDDHPRVHSILDKLLAVLHEFPGQYHNGGGPVADFCILAQRNISKRLCRWMYNIQELHYCSTVVGDCHLSTVTTALVAIDELVHPKRSKSRSNDIYDCHTCVHVRDELSFSLRSIRSLFKEHDLRCQKLRHCVDLRFPPRSTTITAGRSTPTGVLSLPKSRSPSRASGLKSPTFQSFSP